MIETIADHLTLEQADRVAVVTINRPEARNSMTFEMYEGLHGLCERLDADEGVRVMILRGAGDKAFASGTDIRQFQTFKTREDALGYEARIGRVLNRIAGMRKPTIAMIQGDAVGGGMFMSLACDLRLAAEHAHRGIGVERGARVVERLVHLERHRVAGVGAIERQERGGTVALHEEVIGHPSRRGATPKPQSRRSWSSCSRRRSARRRSSVSSWNTWRCSPRRRSKSTRIRSAPESS